MTQTDPRSFLPLTPHAFQVLLALADGERHGYGIILEVGARTDGVIRLRTGTLYVLLQRLSDEGLVALATGGGALRANEKSPREESDSGSAGARASGGGAPRASEKSPREESDSGSAGALATGGGALRASDRSPREESDSGSAAARASGGGAPRASDRSPREESDSGSAAARASGGGAPRASEKRPREDSRRRYYRLTDLGRAVLVAEARRLEAALVDARRKRVFGTPRPR